MMAGRRPNTEFATVQVYQMRCITLFAASAALALGFGAVAPATAGGIAKHLGGQGQFTQHPRSGYYRGAPQVRGFRKSVGGYSYSYSDSVLDFRDRALLDPSLRGPSSGSGPFDSGFFFDSGIGSPTSNAPY